MYLSYPEYVGMSGITMSDTDFDRLAPYAHDIIDQVCGYRIDFCTLSDFDKQQVRKAVAAQVDMLYEQGGIEAVMGWGASSGANSVSIGKFSYSGGVATSEMSTDRMNTINGIPVSPLVEGYLLPTNLLYAGVDVYGC